MMMDAVTAAARALKDVWGGGVSGRNLPTPGTRVLDQNLLHFFISRETNVKKTIKNYGYIPLC